MFSLNDTQVHSPATQSCEAHTDHTHSGEPPFREGVQLLRSELRGSFLYPKEASIQGAHEQTTTAAHTPVMMSNTKSHKVSKSLTYFRLDALHRGT